MEWKYGRLYETDLQVKITYFIKLGNVINFPKIIPICKDSMLKSSNCIKKIWIKERMEFYN